MSEITPQLPPPRKPRGPGKRTKEKRNRSFEQTHEDIHQAYIEFFTDKQRNPRMKQPTIAQLAKMTGYATRTIERHIADLDKDVNMGRRVRKYRLASDLILKSWLIAAVKDRNVYAGEKFINVVEGISTGNMVRVETPDQEKGPDLSKASKEDLAAYKAALAKLLLASQKGSDGSPQSGA